MKKLLLNLLLIAGGSAANAQNGLENIIVEKYYVSNANDTTVNEDGGSLPVGSVTYRIYVDLLPGYKFQAAYGVPNHELKIHTSTSFFNNEDRGAIAPTYTKAQAANNTVMLDSWLSAGGACAGNLGILKSSDNGIANVVNADGVLQNNDPSAGIPLTLQDGLIAGIPEDLTVVGMEPDLVQLDATNAVGGLIATTNGSWASLNGSTGPTPANQVLIAQLTTDGTFSFKLNIQIGTPNGEVQNYVADNPGANEIYMPQLTYSSLSASVKLFFQGYYLGGGLMQPVLFNQGVAGADPTQTDTVLIELRSVADANVVVDAAQTIIGIDGTGIVKFTEASKDGIYWIVVKHRNSIQTWSASPIGLTSLIDFSTAANKSFGDNMVDLLGESIFSIYSGDLNQDEYIDIFDFPSFDLDNQNFVFLEYKETDFNGDGYVDIFDFPIFDSNNQSFISAIHP